MTPRALRRFLTNVDAWAQPERFALFLLACEADARGRTGFENREYSQPRYLLDFMEKAPKPVNVEHKHRMMGESLVKRLAEMPLDARLEVFAQFCMDCGESRYTCGCASGVKSK
jgi:tRNA nucleotidyltransferase (CCA-adding enzyme)